MRAVCWGIWGSRHAMDVLVFGALGVGSAKRFDNVTGLAELGSKEM